MNKLLRRLWPRDVYRRLIHLLGFAIFVGTFAVAVYFYVNEKQYIWNPDLLGLLIGGSLYAAVTLVPYWIASEAAKKTNRSNLFFVVSLLVFIVHIWLSVDALFLPKGSTSGVGIFFFPFYLSVPIILAWGLFPSTMKAARKNQWKPTKKHITRRST